MDSPTDTPLGPEATALMDFLRSNTDEFLSGSGWDYAWHIQQLGSSPISLEIYTSFHYMHGETGMYWGNIPISLHVTTRRDGSFYIFNDNAQQPIWWDEEWEDQPGEKIHPDFEQFSDSLMDDVWLFLPSLLDEFNQTVLSTVKQEGEDSDGE